MTAWSAYRVVLRLHSPLHIGNGRVSYLQRTRPYVTGRVLRGALVSRVARNQNLISTDPKDPYRCVSKTFAQFLTFTYFYPTLKAGNDYQARFFWEDEANFRRRFLSSYAATALEYPTQTAAEGLLYETEFISPYTLDDGKPVYLTGYVFAQDERLKNYDWKGGFRRLQLGGERGYGWGEARSVEISEKDDVFGLKVELGGKRPRICVPAEKTLLAHVPARDAVIQGYIEPVVGREWRADNKERRNSKRVHIGQHLAFDGVYFAPGSRATTETWFAIGKGGYWYPTKEPAT